MICHAHVSAIVDHFFVISVPVLVCVCVCVCVFALLPLVTAIRSSDRGRKLGIARFP